MRSLMLLTVPVMCAISVAGCGNSDDLSSPAANRLRTLATVYLDYAVAKGTGPANEQQLHKHVQSVPGFLLEAGGVNPKAGSAAFVSERDGEQFVVRYGVGISQAEGDEAPIIAYEKTGKDGTRFVAFANGKVDCIDDIAAMELMHEKL